MREDNDKSAPSARGDCTVTSPPLGGVSEYFHGRSSDFADSNLLAGLPKARPQCRRGVRICLPLRGSSGFSPDSLFTLLRRSDRGIQPLYIEPATEQQPRIVHKRLGGFIPGIATSPLHALVRRERNAFRRGCCRCEVKLHLLVSLWMLLSPKCQEKRRHRRECCFLFDVTTNL